MKLVKNPTTLFEFENNTETNRENREHFSQSNTLEEIIRSLNPEQKEATTIINGPVQVIAGAGSGKTKVLTSRIAYLIQQGINPRQILALTFTNKAAREMKERISKYVSQSISDKIWAGTFHSIFARILRIEAEAIGYNRDFSIYDSDDSNSLIKEIMRDFNFTNQEFTANNAHSYISKLKNELVSPDEFDSISVKTTHKHYAKLYREYQHRLRKNNAMDFDDLLINTLDLLTSNKEILEKYQSHFKYILVDEFQDTNRPQYLIVRNLAKAHSNLFVVGDDAQSIYRWRGAEIKNILNFEKDFPHTKMVRLEQNYRSTSTILEAAHSVIENNRNQIKKKLWTNNEQGEIIDIYSSEDDTSEGDRIAELIIQQLEKKYDYQDIAILYRTNAQSLLLERALRFRNIPYQIYGGTSFYQRKEIKDIVAYLRLLINPNDSVSLLRVINEPPRGLGKTSLEHIIRYSRIMDYSLFESFASAGSIDELQMRAKKSALGFAELINKYRDMLTIYSLDTVVPDFIEETGILQMYKEIDTEDTNDRWNNIQQLIDDIIRFSKENPNFTLSDYLQQISLLTDFDTKDTSTNKVMLMTLHTAKGLEFPVVLIPGMEKGLFPIVRDRLSKEEEEEERRLFYVGITRAKKKLILSFAKKRSRFGEYQVQTPSGFIFEIKNDFVKWHDRQYGFNRGTSENYGNDSLSNYSQNSYSQNSFNQKPFGQKTVTFGSKPKSFQNSGQAKQNYFDDDSGNYSYSQIKEDSPFSKGEYVKHSHFGVGRIVGISGFGQDAKITVDFESVGRKQLMLSFAKLQKITK